MATQEEMEALEQMEQEAMALRFRGDESQAEAAERRANAMRQAIWARLAKETVQ